MRPPPGGGHSEIITCNANQHIADPPAPSTGAAEMKPERNAVASVMPNKLADRADTVIVAQLHHSVW